MDIAAYLKRIDYQNSLEISKKILFNLQKAHLLAVPFENLDIHYNQPILLDLPTIFNKIVKKGRGGFCYELNGLFYYLLKAIGFDAKIISARVANEKGVYGVEYDHLAIVVNVEGQDFLVDVGFGQFSFEPLEIQFEMPIEDHLAVFQFETYDEYYLKVSTLEKEQLVPQYIFKLLGREWSEFEDMCHYHQTNSKSHFTQKKVISILTKNGRITLNNDELKIRNNHKTEAFKFPETQFEFFLEKYFNIRL